MAETENIIIKDTLDGLGTDAYSNYLAHALCLAGSCRLRYNGEERELQAGDLMIVRKGKLVEHIRPAEDFRVKVIYVTSEFVVLSTPLSNYGMKGQLALFLNPIMKLNAEQRELCRKDFEMVEFRLAQTGHHFRRDLLIASVQLLIIDFFDFHLFISLSFESAEKRSFAPAVYRDSLSLHSRRRTKARNAHS